MSGSERTVVREIIVVEGLHDKQAVDEAVAAEVWILGGDRIAHTVLSELKRASNVRGVIVLTDPDGPGERIRRRIDQTIPGCKHAFIAKRDARSEHGVGVEHASPEVIRQALKSARQNQEAAGASNPTDCDVGSSNSTDATSPLDPSYPLDSSRLEKIHSAYADAWVPEGTFTMQDLVTAGLANGKDAASRRQFVGDQLSLGYGNAKAFLRKLNVLGVGRTEWERAVAQLKETEQDDG